MSEDSDNTSASGEMRVRVFGRTDVGQVREHNEDSFIIADLSRKSRSLREEDRVQTIGAHGTLMAVCDGMGGAAAGEVASELAVNIIYEKLVDGDVPKNHDDLARRVVRAIEAAGLRIYSEAKLDRHHRGMGTTATVAALLDSYLFLGQVGDSRAYVLRNDRLVQVTRDQSLVTQLIEAGQLTEEEAETFEHNNIILQALGTADTVQVDLTYVPLLRGDTLLLCSDGLSGMIRYEDIRRILLEHDDTVEVCKALTKSANEAGGHDNITVIVARFEGEGFAEAGNDDPPLRYSKYVLPEDAGSEPTIPGRRGLVKGLDRPKIGPEVRDRNTDHGPSRSKVAHTLVGMRSPMHDKDYDDEEIVLPVENTPLWVLCTIVVAVFGSMVFAAYYFIIKP
ncbi:MAG: hypothetical protein CSA75_00865 [Sorangium cellulosum]|nr:MAG: hypothetical protein CSA75_00865 [Sorangium cellulosum]